LGWTQITPPPKKKTYTSKGVKAMGLPPPGGANDEPLGNKLVKVNFERLKGFCQSEQRG